jgi:small nuclear ribonucleoprotein (snRNP)-like protein
MYERYHTCLGCVNRRVSVQTIGGATYEGVIVRVDQQNVYLDTSGINAYSEAVISSKSKKLKTSAFGFGGRTTILTLALFDLLAIALLV